MDYYDILGISIGGTDQEIKKAYRKLAMIWHPDKNQSNVEEARLKFLEIAEAYDVLCDKEKKAIYDQYGYHGLKNGVSNPDHDGEMRQGYAFSDATAEANFSRFFGTDNPFMDFGFGETMPFVSPTQGKRKKKTSDLEHAVHISLEELYNVASKKVTIVRDRPLCSPDMRTKVLTLKICPSWENGSKVTFEGEGNEIEGHKVGDLVLTIGIKEHEHFKREAQNLIYTVKIKLADALSDFMVEIPTLNGRKLPIACNEVISPATQKIIKNEGLIVPQSSGFSGSGGGGLSPSKIAQRGDLKIKFDIKFPSHLTEMQKKALVKILV